MLSLLLALPGRAQSAEQCLAWARQQQQAGNYETALRACQRVLFFQQGRPQAQLYKQMAECYRQLGLHTEAAASYDLAYDLAATGSEKQEMIFGKAEALLLQGNYQLAMAELLNLPDSLPQEQHEARAFYLGIAHFGLNRFPEAEVQFRQVVAKGAPAWQDTLHGHFVRNRKRTRLSPNLARALSVVVPGAGQFYAGDVKNGLNSLVLTSGLAVVLVHTAAVYSVPVAVASVFPWMLRYYRGGFGRAKAIAERRRNARKAETYAAILQTIAAYRSTGQPEK